MTTELRPRKWQSSVSQAAASRSVLGYVLAGGASSRFGKDKALVELGGKVVLERILDSLKESGVRETRVVGAKEMYGRFGARCIKDKWPGEGPLGGIVTALWSTVPDKYGYRWNLILGCDMPFLSAEWFRFLVERSKKSEADVVLARSEHGLEPLCACWRTSAAASLQAAFDEGARKVTDAMKRLRMEVLDEREWKRFDSAGRLFWNMNTPQDYQAALQIWETSERERSQ
jgi:molybdopterin-guanine dinucleotide biosynthesis protein A